MGRGDSEFDETGSDPAGVTSHAVFQALALVEQAAQTLDGVATWSLSDGEVRDAVAGLFAHLQGVEAGWLGLVRGLDARPDAVAGARPGDVAKTFLIHRLRQTPAQAGRDVRAAHALDPAGTVLPRLGAALAAGQVSRAHVDVAVTARADIPKRMLEHVDEATGRSGADRVDEELTSHARAFNPKTAQALAGHLLSVLDPTLRDRYDPDAYLRRRLTSVRDSTGMLIGRFQLDPAGAIEFTAAIDRFSPPKAATTTLTEHGQQVLLGDERTAEQRRADALVTISRIALQHATDTTPTGPLTHVSVVATPEQVSAARAHHPQPDQPRQSPQPGQPDQPGRHPQREDARPQPDGDTAPGQAECLQTGPIDTGTLARLACDAILQAVLTTTSGAVLNLGRSVRTVTLPQRRALIARDQGCVIPGCAAPVTTCDAHHVSWWRHGGGTDLDNLVLLCSHHHTAVHAGIWVITIRDGIPWMIPPPWITPDRQPVRNQVADARTQAEQLGRQLRLPITDPPHHSDG